MAVSKHTTMSPLGEQFAEHIYTKDEFLHKLGLLEEFVSRHLFNADNKGEGGTLEAQIKKFSASQSKAHEKLEQEKEEEEGWLGSLGKDFFAHFTAQNANKLFSEIEAYLKDAPIVNLSVARSIPEEQQKEIGKWIKKNVGPAALYDIRVMPELIGGCSISFKGLFQDFSMQNTLTRERKNIIAELQAAIHAK